MRRRGLFPNSIALSEDNCWSASVCYVLPENAGDAEFDQSNYSVVEISNAVEGWTLPWTIRNISAPAIQSRPQLDVGSKIYAFNVVTDKVGSLDVPPVMNAMHSSVTTITNTHRLGRCQADEGVEDGQ